MINNDDIAEPKFTLKMMCKKSGVKREIFYSQSALGEKLFNGAVENHYYGVKLAISKYISMSNNFQMGINFTSVLYWFTNIHSYLFIDFFVFVS